MTVCNRCGKENQDHYKFCLGCGAELTAAPKPGGDVAMMKTMMQDPSAQSPTAGAPLRGGSAAMPQSGPPAGLRSTGGGGIPGMPPSGPLGGVARPRRQRHQFPGRPLHLRSARGAAACRRRAIGNRSRIAQRNLSPRQRRACAAPRRLCLLGPAVTSRRNRLTLYVREPP